MSVLRIEGKRAVVTGGAVGIGRAIALRLAAAGAEVVVADLDVAGGSRTCELIGSSTQFVRVDMRVDAAVTDLMACQPQILVNNAGGGAVLRPCFPEASVERWSASLELNLRGRSGGAAGSRCGTAPSVVTTVVGKVWRSSGSDPGEGTRWTDNIPA
ncbi:SDR family NAD(P)-dependent oxidoreductase [Kribbella sp. CWNU-51]